MGLLNINQAAEVKTGGEHVKAGTYRMRVREVTDRNPEKNDLRIVLEHTVPQTELLGIDGAPLSDRPTLIYDYIMLDFEKQWKLRQLTEAAGLPWQNYDPQSELVGRELDVVIKNEVYEGEQRNKVGRYVIPK